MPSREALPLAHPQRRPSSPHPISASAEPTSPAGPDSPSSTGSPVLPPLDDGLAKFGSLEPVDEEAADKAQPLAEGAQVPAGAKEAEAAEEAKSSPQEEGKPAPTSHAEAEPPTVDAKPTAEQLAAAEREYERANPSDGKDVEGGRVGEPIGTQLAGSAESVNAELEEVGPPMVASPVPVVPKAVFHGDALHEEYAPLVAVVKPTPEFSETNLKPPVDEDAPTDRSTTPKATGASTPEDDPERTPRAEPSATPSIELLDSRSRAATPSVIDLTLNETDEEPSIKETKEEPPSVREAEEAEDIEKVVKIEKVNDVSDAPAEGPRGSTGLPQLVHTALPETETEPETEPQIKSEKAKGKEREIVDR